MMVSTPRPHRSIEQLPSSHYFFENGRPMNSPSLTVLIVEDNDEDRRFYTRLLHRQPAFDVQVRLAKTGEEGLAIAQHDPPACIILDYLLPDMDGL